MKSPPTAFKSSFTSSNKNPSSKPTLKEMKAYVHNNVYNTPYLCTAGEDIIYNFNNIPTADNSQPPIFRSDITAGQFESNDDDSDAFTEDFSDNVYSFEHNWCESRNRQFPVFFPMT